MPSVSFVAPVWLWALLLIPAAWAAARWSHRAFSVRQRRVQLAARSVTLAGLALALARPVADRATTDTTVVYLVDVSHSVASRAIIAAADRIDVLKDALAPAHARIIAFGRQAAVVADTGALRSMAADPDQLDSNGIDRRGTNLERAFAAADAELGAGTNGRVVLFSDGRATNGTADAAADRLAAHHVPVFAQVLDVRDVGDTWVAQIEPPPDISDGQRTDLVIAVGSQRAGRAEVTVREGEQQLGRAPADLERGTTHVTVPVTIKGLGPHVLTAHVAHEQDPLAINDSLSREVLVGDKVGVLLAQPPTGSPLLARALDRAGFVVKVIGPEALPPVTDALEPWDVVVLSNVARSAVARRAMDALDSWVQDRGGGLLFVGGGAVFGESAQGDTAGYRNSALERVLPVTFEREDTPEVALVLVLDRSWSMRGEAMDLCKAAAQAAVDSLADSHVAGVVTFSNDYEWNVPVSPLKNKRADIRQAIGSIQASGPTLIFPALQQAYLALSSVRARAKHVILLSDGQTDPDDYQALAQKMAAARITVSTVALGPEADATLLRNIATWGKGKSYVVHDAREVPRIFVTEAKSASAPGFDADGTIGLVLHDTGVFRGTLTGSMPRLRGRTAVTSKPHALDLLRTTHGEPVLTTWPAGLGRTAIFAADADGVWTRDWPSWTGYEAFFSAIAGHVARRRVPLLALQAENAAPGRLDVTLDVRDGAGRFGDLLHPTAEIVQGADLKDVSLTQVGPGHYMGSVPVDEHRDARITLGGVPGAPSVARVLVADEAAEYRFEAPDRDALRRLTRLTGGAMSVTADTLRAVPSTNSATPRGLSSVCLSIALAAWLIDIVVRRLRF